MPLSKGQDGSCDSPCAELISGGVRERMRCCVWPVNAHAVSISCAVRLAARASRKTIVTKRHAFRLLLTVCCPADYVQNPNSQTAGKRVHMAKAKQIAIKGKTLIDGNGGPVVADPVILLEGSRIAEVGSKDKVKIPHGVEVVDASHCTLMPGMMDLHIHLCMFNNRTFKNYRVAQWEVTPHLQQMYAYFHS
jgi:hypothetical protein